MRILGLKPADAFVFAIYTSFVFAGVAHHEPWADEAQSWLIARDSSLAHLLFQALRYEGTPGLWHVVNWIASHAGLPYITINYLAAIFASAGIYILLRHSPFPPPFRQILPFTYFLCYQYAVIARNYVLAPVLCFGIAYLIRQRSQNYLFLAVLGGLLANVSVHGCIIAAALLGGYFLLDQRPPLRESWIGLALFGAFCVLAVVSARPAPDCNFIAPQASKLTPAAASAAHLNWTRLLVTKLGRAATIASMPFSKVPTVGVVCLLALSALMYQRRRLVYVLPIPLLMAFFSLIYVSAWHTGLLLVCALTALWIGWPEERPDNSPILLITFCTLIAAMQIPWTVHAFRFDWSGEYDGSQRAARSLVGKQGKVFGYGPYSPAVNAYFPRQIFANQTDTYWIWSSRNTIDKDTARIATERPEYLLIAGRDPQDPTDDLAKVQAAARSAGYSVMETYQGRLVFRDEFLETNQYQLWSANSRWGRALY